MKLQEQTLTEQEASIKEAASLLLDFVRKLRAGSFLSQAQLASILGLKSHGNINAIETGKICPRLDTFLRILSVFDYDLAIVPQGSAAAPPGCQNTKVRIETSEYHKAASEQATHKLLQEAKELRQKARISQPQLAAILGLKSHGNINAIEAGKVFPRIDSFLRYLAALQHTAVIRPKHQFNDQVGH